MSDQSPRFRQVLDQFAGYKPGKAPAATAGRSFKLSSNESPYDPLPSVQAVLANYPEITAQAQLVVQN